MKLTPGVNFINVSFFLRAAFALVDPKSVKIQLSHQCLLTLLGSTSIKAVSRTLMKLSPDRSKKCRWPKRRREAIHHFRTICSLTAGKQRHLKNNNFGFLFRKKIPTSF